jgi:hypothetical protein
MVTMMLNVRWSFFFPDYTVSVYVDKKSADTAFGYFPSCLLLAVDCFTKINHRVWRRNTICIISGDRISVILGNTSLELDNVC